MWGERERIRGWQLALLDQDAAAREYPPDVAEQGTSGEADER
jgi:hypothetical protein